MRFTLAGLIALCAVLPVSSGCVALSIPSERVHDPDDHGGLFGDWKRGREHTSTHQAEATLAAGGTLRCDTGSGCLSGTMPLDVDPHTGERTGCFASNKQPKAPEVPWPRFHPIPTRPVFE